MAWQDSYRQASFRGVKFYVRSHQGSGGRRTQITELPGRDNVQAEDLGGRKKQFSIEAYVIGESYNVDRNNLIQALDKKGVGKLIHPYMGEMQVTIPNYTWRDSLDEMNMARFTLQVVVVSDLEFPVVVVDTQVAVDEAKVVSLSRLQEAFWEAYNVLTSTKAMIDEATSTLSRSVGRAEALRYTMSDAAAYRAELVDLVNAAGWLANGGVDEEGKNLFDKLVEMLSAGTSPTTGDVRATEDNARNQFDEMRNLWELEPEDTFTSEPSTELAGLIADANNMAAAVVAVGLLSVVEFTSADEAEELGAIALAELDHFLETAADDELYEALYDLRAASVKDLNSRARTLPRLVEYTPIVSLPALVISHDLYGTIDREQEILDRNRIVHPGFVPGSVPIEVLIDVQ